jgi:hypothetical protein
MSIQPAQTEELEDRALASGLVAGARAPQNGCATCGEDFGSVDLFDRHRCGEYGPGDYKGDLENWTPEQGRRCLTIAEMQAKGWCLGKRGRWMDPAKGHAGLEAVSSASERHQEVPA